jgi:hypothetical protein
MTTPIELVPLKCIHCNTPIAAQIDEVAWVCEQCGQGLQIDEEQGLVPLDIRYADGIQPGKKGRPFWVVEGRVSLDRKTYSGIGNKTGEAERFWDQPRRFFIPAFDIALEDLVVIGPQMLRHHPELQTGPAASFLPVTLSNADISPLAEFIVVAIEAERKDKVKSIEYSLSLGEAQLWVIP